MQCSLFAITMKSTYISDLHKQALLIEDMLLRSRRHASNHFNHLSATRGTLTKILSGVVTEVFVHVGVIQYL